MDGIAQRGRLRLLPRLCEAGAGQAVVPEVHVCGVWHLLHGLLCTWPTRSPRTGCTGIRHCSNCGSAGAASARMCSQLGPKPRLRPAAAGRPGGRRPALGCAPPQAFARGTRRGELSRAVDRSEGLPGGPECWRHNLREGCAILGGALTNGSHCWHLSNGAAIGATMAALAGASGRPFDIAVRGVSFDPPPPLPMGEFEPPRLARLLAKVCPPPPRGSPL